MLSTRRLGWGALLSALALVVPAVAAAQSPLAQVPAEAPVVLQIRGIERTKDRIVTMIKNALPDLGAAAQDKLDEGLRAALEGRSLKGVAPDGPVFVMLTRLPQPGEEEDAASRVAAMVRVTNYDQFRTGILTEDERKSLKRDAAGYDTFKINDREFCLVHHNGFAILTPSKDVAAQFAKDQDGLDRKLDKRIAAKLLAADVGLYVNLQAINDAYGAQIAQVRQLLPFLLQQQASQVEQLKANAELVKQMLDAFFQGLEDSRAGLIAFEFRPEGFAFHLQDQVSADSSTNRFLKDSKPAKLEEMQRLPGGRMIYSGMHLDSNLIKAMQSLVFGVQLPDEKQSEEFKSAMKELFAGGPQARLDAFNMPMQGIQVWKYQEPAKAAAGMQKLFQAMGSGEGYQNAVLKEKPVFKANAEKYRGFTFSHVRLVWDLEKMVAANFGGKEVADNVKRFTEEMLAKTLGKGMNIWFGSDGKAFVQLVAKDWDDAKGLLDQYLDGKDPVGQQASFQAARKQLPAEVTFLVLMEARAYALTIAGLLKGLPQLQENVNLPPNFPALEAGKDKPSYLGAAVTLQPQHGSVDVWVPGAAAGTFYQIFVEPLMKR